MGSEPNDHHLSTEVRNAQISHVIFQVYASEQVKQKVFGFGMFFLGGSKNTAAQEAFVWKPIGPRVMMS